LAYGRAIRATRDVHGGADDLGVIPAGRKFRLAWFADAVPVPSAAGLVSIENVCGALGGNAY